MREVTDAADEMCLAPVHDLNTDDLFCEVHFIIFAVMVPVIGRRVLSRF